MKRSLINKLGTSFNIIGSLGVGYYAGKFGLFIEPTTILGNTELVQISGSFVILLIGVVLRVRDIRSHSQKERDLVGEVKWAENIADQQTDRFNEAQDQLDATERLFDTVVRRVILEDLPKLVEEYLEKKERKSEDRNV